MKILIFAYLYSKYHGVFTLETDGRVVWEGDLCGWRTGWEGDFTVYPFLALEFYFIQKIKYKQFTNYPAIYFHIIQI